MKKSELRKIIREHLNEFFDTPYGKWDGRFTPGWEQPDQWYDNIATDGGLTTQNKGETTIKEQSTPANYVCVNNDRACAAIGRWNDPGGWKERMDHRINSAHRPCDFIQNKSNRLTLKLSGITSNPDWQALLNFKIRYFQDQSNHQSC